MLRVNVFARLPAIPTKSVRLGVCHVRIYWLTLLLFLIIKSPRAGETEASYKTLDIYFRDNIFVIGVNAIKGWKGIVLFVSIFILRIRSKQFYFQLYRPQKGMYDGKSSNYMAGIDHRPIAYEPGGYTTTLHIIYLVSTEKRWPILLLRCQLSLL